MDLHRQLRDVLYLRVLFTLAVLSAALWTRIDTHGLAGGELVAALVAAAALTVPFFVLAGRVRLAPLVAAMTVLDLALVTAAVVLGGGALGAVPVF